MQIRIVAFLLVVLALGCLVPPLPVLQARQGEMGRPPQALDPMDQPTAVPPEILTGTLRNGLTYYVKWNTNPPKRAALWLAVKAGSVLEDDNQRGFAHFVEHMAFRGTKRFPKNQFIDYLEKVGMRFGADFNATTTFDTTVYEFTVPTHDSSVVATGLDILRDMAGDVTFDSAELEAERGVVLEEWRKGRDATARAADKLLPIIFRGSRYADRLPIGTTESLKTAKRDALIKFYKDWYRPDLMAVIAVGDFDPHVIQYQIETRFSDLKEQARPPPGTDPQVPQHDLAVGVASDPEMEGSGVIVCELRRKPSDSTKRDYRRNLFERLHWTMLNERFHELSDDPGSSLMWPKASIESLSRTMDIFVLEAVAKEGRVPATIETIFREIARVERHGFVSSELERAKRILLAAAKQGWFDADNRAAYFVAEDIRRHFLLGNQIPGPQFTYQWHREFLPGITLDEVNRFAGIHERGLGRAIAVLGPAISKLPDENVVRASATRAAKTPVAPWQDEGADQPLFDNAPVPGKVVRTTHDENADVTVWTLANGVRVVTKPRSETHGISFTGWLPGGSSVVPDADFVHARFADKIAMASGAGALDPRALRKALAGKLLHVDVAIEERSARVFGDAQPDDLATALELIHLRLTAPRVDRRAFARWKAAQIENERHRGDSPEHQFEDAMTVLQTNNHPRRRPVSMQMIEQVDVEKAISIYRNRLLDLGGFTFVFVGDFDREKLGPLVETYLGSLPSKGRREMWKDIGVSYAPGKVEKTVVGGIEPKSVVSIIFSGDDAWTVDGERDARILQMVLEMRLNELLREELGGVYGVSVSAKFAREPRPRRTLAINFTCAPDNVGELRDATFAEIAKIRREGLSDMYVTKIVEQLRRSHEVELVQNPYWMNLLRDAFYYGDDVSQLLDNEATVKRVTTASFRASATRFLDESNVVVGVLKPKGSVAAP